MKTSNETAYEISKRLSLKTTYSTSEVWNLLCDLSLRDDPNPEELERDAHRILVMRKVLNNESINVALLPG